MKRWSLARGALLAVVSAGLIACSSSGPVNEPTELVDIDNPTKVDRVWKASTASSDLNLIYDRIQPAIADGVVYSASAKGVLYAFDRAEGDKLWKQKLDVVVSAGVGINDTALFVGTAKGEVLAVTRDSGEIIWRKQLASEILTTPVATATHVVVRASNGLIYGLDVASGNEVWQHQRSLPALMLRGESVPVVTDELVLLGTADGRLVALSVYDGSVVWESSIVVAQGRTDLERMVDVDATPVVVGDTVYSVAYQGRVVALSLSTGALMWSRDVGSSAGISVDRYHVYVVDDEDQVWALDRNNGSTLWKQDSLKYRDVSTPVTLSNAVVVGDFEGYLHWLSLDDGTIFARRKVDSDGVRVAPLVVDETLYVRSKTGRLDALVLVK